MAAAANHGGISFRGDNRAFLLLAVCKKNTKIHCESVSTAAPPHFAFVSARSRGNATAYITDFTAILMTFFFCL